MRRLSASASRLSRFVPAAATLIVLACGDSTSPGVPTKLVFLVQPTNTFAATRFSPAVAVAIQDEAGNTVTSATNDVSIEIAANPRNGTLSGTFTVAAVRGVATFPDLTINFAATGYTLNAFSPNLAGAISAPFGIVTGPATKLGFTSQPVTSIANAMLPTVTVEVQDAGGNAVAGATDPIKLVIGNNPGNGTLSGNTVAPALNGVASFSGLSISNTGIGYTLVASSASLTGATSTPFDVIIGPASKLAFMVQPGTTRPGTVISPAVAVAVQDVAGNTVTAANVNITMSIGVNVGNGTLSGTTTVTAVNGVATFPDLSIDNSGEGYKLAASATNLTTATSEPFGIRTPPVFATITAGYFHSCGVSTTSVAYCWGAGASGQLGNAGTSQSLTLVAVTSGGVSFAAIGAGRNHTCAVSTPGRTAFCWGENDNGRLGDGGTASSSVPVAVSGGRNYTAVIAGYAHTCGVTTSGDGYCWGDNSAGEIGDNTLGISHVPVAVSGGYIFASISPGRYFTCGLTTAGAGYCWGTNGEGELGNGSTTQSSSPVAVSGNLTFATLSVGNRHTCGVTTGGAAYCWGDNSSGNLGNSTTVNSYAPSPVSGGLTFSSVSAGRFHTCGITTGGAGYCWGDNSTGRLGDGTTVLRTAPVQVR